MKKKRNKIWLIVLLSVFVLGSAAVLGVNGYVKSVGGRYMLSPATAAGMQDVDCIVVLGCQVRDDGTPSPMLRDRLQRAVELYDLGTAPKLLMSGDHSREDYDEVGAMKRFAVEAGVPSEDVFMDHAGFSTYETMYRAKEMFGAEKVLVVTQEYHLYRAVYIARQLGMEAYGVPAEAYDYAGQSMRDAREVLARCKDFAVALWQPELDGIGEVIPVSGNGDATNVWQGKPAQAIS